MANHRRTRRRRNPACVICNHQGRADGNGKANAPAKVRRADEAAKAALAEA
jgi:hypothetical protein